MDPIGAQRETLDVARRLRIGVTVSVAYEFSIANLGMAASGTSCCVLFLKMLLFLFVSFLGSQLSSEGCSQLEGVSLCLCCFTIL